MNYSENLSPPDPVEVKIDQTYFDTVGVLQCFGSVNGQSVNFTIHADEKLFAELLPKDATEDQVINHEGKYIAVLDMWESLHWLVRARSGQILERSVPLTGLLEQKIYDTYINQL